MSMICAKRPQYNSKGKAMAMAMAMAKETDKEFEWSEWMEGLDPTVFDDYETDEDDG
jgi:hypothetical protein